MRRAFVGFVLLLVVAGVWPGWWLPWALETFAPPLARRFAKLDLKLEAVEVATWGRLEARGLLVEAEGERPWIDARLPRVDLAFDTGALLSEPLRAIRRVELTRPRVLLDLSATGADDAPSSENSGGGFGLAWPEALPALTVRDGVFELVGVGPEPIAGTGLELATTEGRTLSLEFREVRPGGWIAMDPLRNGTLTADYADGNWNAIHLVVHGEDLVEAGHADLAGLADSTMSFGLELAIQGATAKATAALADRRWSGDVDLEAFPLPWLDPFLPEDERVAGFVDLAGRWSVPAGDAGAVEVRADLKAVDVSVRSAPVAQVEGAVLLEDGRLLSDSLRIRQSTNELLLTGVRWSLGELDLDDLAFELSLQARDLPALAALGGATIPTETPPPHVLELGAKIASGVLAIDRGYLDTAGGRLSILRGTVNQHPTPDDPRRVELNADFEDLGELGRLFTVGRWTGSLAGDLTYYDQGGGPELRCALVGERVTVEDHELGDVRLGGLVSPPLLLVSDLSSDGPAGHVEGSGVYDWEARSVRDVRLELDLEDLARIAPLAGVSGSATGSVTLTGPLDALDGGVSLRSEGVSVRGWTLRSAAVDAGIHAGDIRLNGLEVADEAATLAMSGDLGFDTDQRIDAVQLESLRVAVDDAALQLVEPADFRWDGSTARLDRLSLAGSAGTLDLSLEWGPTARRVDLSASELRLDELLDGRDVADFALEGVDGELHVSIEDERAVGRSDLSLRGLVWPGLGPALDVRFVSLQRDGVLAIERCSVDSDAGSLLTGTARFPLTPLSDEWLPDQELELRFQSGAGLAEHLGVALGHPDTRGSLDVSLALGGTTAAPTGSLTVAVDELHWAPGEDLPAVGPADVDLDVRLVENGARIEAGRASLNSAEALSIEGELRAPTDLRRYAADPAAAWSEAEYDLHVFTRAFDWQRVTVQLERLGVPPSPVRTGVFDADLAILGPADEPRIEGSASLTEGSARVGTLPSISEVSADVTFSGRQLELVGFRGELGGADFVLSGTMLLGDAGLEFDARLKGDDLLVVRSGGTRVRANVDATVRGPLAALVIAGKAQVAEGIYSTPIDVTSFLGGPKPVRARGLQLFRISEGPMRDARFDLTVDTAPDSSFQIATSTYKGGLRPDLHLGGTGELPILTGVVYFDPAVVNLPATRLRVVSGTLVFDEANPFVPELQILAEGRMRGYDVTAQVSGPFDATEVTMSSDPPLNGTELLNLVLTGSIPGDDSTRAGDVAQQLATYLAKDFLSWWISPEPGDKSSDSMMDRIEIISGEDVSQTGASTIEGRFRFAEDVTREDDALYVIAQRDEYDFYNAGIRISFRVR